MQKFELYDITNFISRYWGGETEFVCGWEFIKYKQITLYSID